MLATEDARAARGIKRVEFHINGQFAASTNIYESNAFIAVPIPQALAPGIYEFRVTAYDDADNAGSASVNINLSGSPQ